MTETRCFLTRVLCLMVLCSCGDGIATPSGPMMDAATALGDARFDSIWQRKTVDVVAVDPSHPQQLQKGTVDFPGTITDGVDGTEIEFYRQIKDRVLITYAARSGESVYYCLRSPLQQTDSGYVLMSATPFEYRVFTIERDQLVEDGNWVDPTLTYSVHAIYQARIGDFPPDHWPKQKIEVTQ